MKNLNKLQINSGKLMKNEELIALKGGTNCFCLNQYGGACATGTAGSASECEYMCEAAGCHGDHFWLGY
jgi:hypothetical protein